MKDGERDLTGLARTRIILGVFCVAHLKINASHLTENGLVCLSFERPVGSATCWR